MSPSKLLRRRNDEQGFTLVELSVVLLLGSIVSFILFNFLDNTSLIVSRSTTSVRTEADARLVMRTVLQDLRAAQNISTTYPVTSTCPTGVTYPAGYSSCIQFQVLHPTSAGGSCPYSKITYGLVSGTLKADRVDYSSTCVARTVFTGKTILKNIVNGTTPLFSFFDQYGNPISTSTGSPTTFAAAGTVNVQVTVQPLAQGPKVSIFSAAALRNNR